MFGSKIIRNRKEDKHKVYNVSEIFFVKDTNKNFHSVDNGSIRDSKILEIYMFTTTCNRNNIFSSNKRILNTTHLYGHDLTLNTPFHSHLPQQLSSSHEIPTSTPKTYIIEDDYKFSKKKTYQSISQDLLYSFFVVTGFVYDLSIEVDHYELQKQVHISSKGNVQSNTLFEKLER